MDDIFFVLLKNKRLREENERLIKEDRQLKSMLYLDLVAFFIILILVLICQN